MLRILAGSLELVPLLRVMMFSHPLMVTVMVLAEKAYLESSG